MPEELVEIIEDDRFQRHVGPAGHPERPERLAALAEALDPFRERVRVVSALPADPEELARVHARPMIDALAATRDRPPGQIDGDTYHTPESYAVACLAAGGASDLVRRVMRGEVTRGLAAIRPPGHHAEADRAMGFCLFNNVAVAVRAVQAEFTSARVLVFDWDVHHGNGTQHIFESDRDVLYISTHQFPFYPGTGDFAEEGEGPGTGTTINIPMPAGCGDSEYLGVVERIVTPAAIGFAPDLIVVSCGFDAHRIDPLASMELTQSGYRGMATILRRLADMLCEGRIVYVLEGGYAATGLREGTSAVLESLVARPADEATDARVTLAMPPDAPSTGPADLMPGSVLRGLVDRVSSIHGRRIPNLGVR